MNLFTLFTPLSNIFKSAGVTLESERKIRSDWEKVTQLMSSKSPAQLKQALIIADKTMDAALKDLVNGETYAERLKNAKNFFDRDTYDKIWSSHKVRNNMVHEVDYDPPYYLVIDSIGNLRKALILLKVNI
jgi:hypothetical protein